MRLFLQYIWVLYKGKTNLINTNIVQNMLREGAKTSLENLPVFNMHSCYRLQYVWSHCLGWLLYWQNLATVPTNKLRSSNLLESYLIVGIRPNSYDLTESVFKLILSLSLPFNWELVRNIMFGYLGDGKNSWCTTDKPFTLREIWNIFYLLFDISFKNIR